MDGKAILIFEKHPKCAACLRVCSYDPRSSHYRENHFDHMFLTISGVAFPHVE